MEKQTSKKYEIIINPTAGRGSAGKNIPRIRALLETGDAEWIWHFTQKRGDAEVMAKEAAGNGADLVVAVGGDGTIHEVVNGVLAAGKSASENLSVGLIPFGTGNDLARELGIYNNLEKACQVVLNDNTIRMDIGVMEGANTGGERHFLVLSGVGFDAQTAKRVNEGIKWISGAPAYIIGALTTLAQFKPFVLTYMADDGQAHCVNAMFASVANAPTTGGGMIIAPGAKLDDGLLDICLVEKVSKPQFIYQLTRVFSGDHVKHPAVSIIRTSSVTLDADPPQPLLIDGEVVGTTPVRIRVLPGAIRMRAPRD